MNVTFEHEIRGYLVGPIWMPATECYKPLSYDLTREDTRYSESDGVHRVGTLRDHILRATNDGDFQHCAIADGTLHTRITIERNGRKYRRDVVRELAQFPSVADCLNLNWAGPSGDFE